jgi:transcriptional regulator with XRE-family HTH domain
MDGVRLARVFRAVRHRHRWRQSDVAERARVSATVISRIEHGRLTELSLEAIERVATALDVQLSIVAHWRGGDLDRMLNSRHAALAERAIAWIRGLGPWVTRPEVSFAIGRERGTVDIVGWWPDRRALLIIELKTDIVDVGELLGTLGRKRRLAALIAAQLGWVPDVIGTCLLIDEGRTNRRRVANHALTLRASLPEDGRRLRAWLQDPQVPLAALAFLPDPQSTNVRRSPATIRRVRRPKSEQG